MTGIETQRRTACGLLTLMFLIGTTCAPAQGSDESCPRFPASRPAPAAAKQLVLDHYRKSAPLILFATLPLTASDAGVGSHTCRPSGSRVLVRWIGVLPAGVRSGWQVGVLHNARPGVSGAYTSFAALAMVSGRWFLVAESPTPFVPFVQATGTHSESARARAIREVLLQCARISTSLGDFASVVGSADSTSRRMRLLNLQSALLDASSSVTRSTRDVSRTPLKAPLKDVAGAMSEFAAAVLRYLEAVPVATTSTDQRTIAAFASLMSEQAKQFVTCAVVGRLKP